MTGFALPYLGLEEVTGNKLGVARSLATEFIGTAVLVQNGTEVKLPGWGCFCILTYCLNVYVGSSKSWIMLSLTRIFI